MKDKMKKTNPLGGWMLSHCSLLLHNEKAIGVILLSIVWLIYQLIYQFKYVAIQEGWVSTWTALMKQGAVPYKDFFTVSAPLNILISYWLDIIGGGKLIVLQIFGIVVSIVTWVMLFLLLCKCYKPKYSFIATLVGAFFFTHAQFFTAFGWLQLAQLFFIIFIYLFVRMYEQIKKNEVPLTSSYFSGFTMSLIFLAKQSSGILVIAAFIVVFAIIAIRDKPKKVWKLLLFFSGGVLTPFLLIGLWLCFNGAFTACIGQVFGGASAKGNPIAILFAFFPRITTPITVVIFCSFCGFMLLLRCLYRNGRLSDYQRLFLKLLATILGIIFSLSASTAYFPYVKNLFRYLEADGKNIYVVIVLLLIGICIVANYLFISHCGQLSKVINRHENIYTFVVTSFLFLFSFMIACSFSVNTRLSVNGTLNTRALTDTWSWYAFYFVVIISVINLISMLFLRKSLYDFKFWILCVASSAWLWSCGMSNTIVPTQAPVAIATIICVLLTMKIKYNRIKNTFITVICITVCFGTLLDRMVQPYSWWGWTESPIVESELVPINVDKMQGFRASPQTANAIETICDLVEENSPKDADLLTFPHISLFNVLTNRFSKHTFSPVHHIDVCTDEVAIADAKAIKENPPDIIVYCVMDYSYPDEFSSYWDIHEYLFREGKRSGQRDIRELIEGWVSDGEFTEIGRVENLVVFKRSQHDK